MATLAAITAVLPERSQHLTECQQSILECRRRIADHGWELHWILVQDGPGQIPNVNPDRFVELQARRGVSAARNVGLSLADAEWVVPLDADDVLEADGLVSIGQALSGMFGR